MLTLTLALALAGPAATPSPGLLDVREARLANGLRVVLAADHTSPTVAVSVVYDVGARNETLAEQGFAHLFEHMMFQGSAHVAAGAHFRLIANRGGMTRATTTSERTLFVDVVPENDLALALWLEADRMKSLDVSQGNLDAQRAVIDEECARAGNDAGRRALAHLQELVYRGSWSYAHGAHAAPALSPKLDAVRAFHDRYYAPSNAVLAIAGDFDPSEVQRLVAKYFGGARRAPQVVFATDAIPPSPTPNAPAQTARGAPSAILYGWSIPAVRDPDHDAVEVAAALLTRGDESRLARALTADGTIQQAGDLAARTMNYRGSDMLAMVVNVATDAANEKVDALLAGALTDLAHLGPTDAEMERVANGTRLDFYRALEPLAERAGRLAERALFWGDASAIATTLTRHLAVTKDDVKRVVTRYLTAERRSRVEVARDGKPVSWDTATLTPNRAPSP